MKDNENNNKTDAAKQYSSLAGLLVGFSITFATLLLTLSTREIKDNIFFEYAITVFVISTFSFLESSEFFIYFTRDKKEINYDIASILYYIGYMSIIFGVIYLLNLFNINYALWISYLFLIFIVVYTISDYIVAIRRDKMLRDVFCFVFIIIYFLVFSYTLLNSFLPCK